MERGNVRKGQEGFAMVNCCFGEPGLLFDGICGSGLISGGLCVPSLLSDGLCCPVLVSGPCVLYLLSWERVRPHGSLQPVSNVHDPAFLAGI